MKQQYQNYGSNNSRVDDDPEDVSLIYSSSSEDGFGFEEDDIDFSAWNPESMPLLKRTIDQARSLGVKRTLSWVAGELKFNYSESTTAPNLEQSLIFWTLLMSLIETLWPIRNLVFFSVLGAEKIYKKS